MKRTYSISRLALLAGLCIPVALSLADYRSEHWAGSDGQCFNYVWMSTRGYPRIPAGNPPPPANCLVYDLCPTLVECKKEASSGWDKKTTSESLPRPMLTLWCREATGGTLSDGKCSNGLTTGMIGIRTQNLEVTEICTGSHCPPQPPPPAHEP